MLQSMLLSKLRNNPTRLATALFLLLSTPNSMYANLPVIDVSSIAQSVLQYYQMVQESIKYEKELAKLGIDTGRVSGILGQLDSLTNGILTSVQAAEDLPNGLFNLFRELDEQCNFLKEIDSFKEQFMLLKKDISDKEQFTEAIKERSACLQVLNDAKFMKDEIMKNLSEAKEALKKADFDTYNSKMNAIKNISKTQVYLRKTAAIEKKENYDAIYNRYINDSGTMGFSKKEMTDRYKKLLVQATKANTQEDAQNLGNQLLAEVVNTLRMQYDMFMEYNSAMLSIQTQDLNVMDKTKAQYLKDDEIKEQKAKVDVFASDSPFEKYKGEYKKDALGLPIIGIGSK